MRKLGLNTYANVGLVAAVAWVAAVAVLCRMSPPARAGGINPAPPPAPRERVIYSFTGRQDGALPFAPLYVDHLGRLIGTTSTGGGGWGAVFGLSRNGNKWVETTLHIFDGSRGATPQAGVIEDRSGAFFGTTFTGGANDTGIAYELAPSGNGYTLTVLHDFGAFDGADGELPDGPLLLGPHGEIFGTTLSGPGNSRGGTVFELKRSGSTYVESILYAFPQPGDLQPGGGPEAGLIEDDSGALYGTTVGDGSLGLGSVFKLTPTASGYRERDIHVFGGGRDGSQPESPLFIDATGALWGTTQTGGNDSCRIAVMPGCGTVFELTPAGEGYGETIVHAFGGGTDGADPFGGLTAGPNGVLYGTTDQGGGGGGTVFSITSFGSGYREAVAHAFTRLRDGSNPWAGLVTLDGLLYGTTIAGGAERCDEPPCGTVFELRP
jgi:uncharacterized repeat protein (TIGR03803 family)